MIRGADVGLARAIAKEVRAANGGLFGLKAMGVMANGRAQVSMNITDFGKTPVSRVHAAVEEIARRHGGAIAEGELIGLIPEEAFEPNARLGSSNQLGLIRSRRCWSVVCNTPWHGRR